MPLPNCNPWISNTVRFSDQQAACKERSAQASANELPDVTFLLTVLDALQRLAVDGVAGFELLDAYNQCDGEANSHNAYAQLITLSAPVQSNKAELKQMILWQLANPLCANNA